MASVSVHSTSGARTNSDESLALNFRESGVKVLWVVVVECSRLTVVFFDNVNQCANIFG
jgi:hypothetical protein